MLPSSPPASEVMGDPDASRDDGQPEVETAGSSAEADGGEVFKIFKQLYPNAVEAHDYQGDIYMHSKNYPAAVQSYMQIIRTES